MFPIEDRGIFYKKEKKEKRAGVINSYLGKYLSKPISFSDLGLRYSHPALEPYNQLLISSEPQSINEEREERASRRKKIRDKAEDLLRRVWHE